MANMILRSLLGSLLGLLFAAQGFAAGGPAKEKAAAAAAQSWLALVDAGQYAKSWDEAAAYFRGAITATNWSASLRAVRAPLGPVISRKVKSTTHRTSLPGAPDGEYVVIQFTTEFANKKSSIETVTPMLDPDARWRVSGYYIR
jgi:hypothetical protein